MRALAAAAIATVLLAALAGGAPAVTISMSETVNGGALNLTNNTSTASVAVTLDGSDKSGSWTAPVTVSDARGTGGGWSVTITSTQFATGTTPTRTLALDASAVTAVSVSCAAGTCTGPTNSIAYPVVVPAGSTAPTAVKIFNAASGTGMGSFTVTPTIATGVLGNAYAGTYTSTVSISVAVGP